MQPFETVYVTTSVVSCNGSGGALGHPLVYLNLSADGEIECPYCSRLFVNRAMQRSAEDSVTSPPTAAEERNA